VLKIEFRSIRCSGREGHCTFLLLSVMYKVNKTEWAISMLFFVINASEGWHFIQILKTLVLLSVLRHVPFLRHFLPLGLHGPAQYLRIGICLEAALSLAFWI
jgi:hypothetical protein